MHPPFVFHVMLKKGEISHWQLLSKTENLNWSLVEMECLSKDKILIATESLGSSQARDKLPWSQERPTTHLGPTSQGPSFCRLFNPHRLCNVRPHHPYLMLSCVRYFNDNSNNNDIIFVDGRDREPNHQDRVLFCMSPSTLSFCLGFKVATYHKAWHFGAPHLQFQILLWFLVKIQANLDTKILIHTS